MLKNYFLITIRTLRQNPLYTALSVFGIALTFVFVCVLFLLAKAVNGDFIPPGYADRTWQINSIEQGSGRYPWITKEQYETWIPKMKTPESILVTTRDMMETVIMNNQSVGLMIIGISENYSDVCRLKYISGRPISKQEIAGNIPVAVIERNIANLYFGKNEDPIGKNFELNGIQYRVVGVVENNSMFGMLMSSKLFANVWIPIGTTKVLNRSSIWYNISFTGKDKRSIADMQAEFTRVLDEAGTAEGEKYTIPGWQKKSVKESDQILGGDIGLVAILFILMLIPALNILSLNVSKSYDRSEEIAIRKAFGAPKSTIFGQLFFENCLLTLTGAVIGMCVTPLLLSAIDKAMLGVSVLPLTLSLRFDWATIIIVAVPCVLVFSFLSGSIPAWITAKREIVNILKGESQ